MCFSSVFYGMISCSLFLCSSQKEMPIRSFGFVGFQITKVWSRMLFRWLVAGAISTKAPLIYIGKLTEVTSLYLLAMAHGLQQAPLT